SQAPDGPRPERHQGDGRGAEATGFLQAASVRHPARNEGDRRGPEEAATSFAQASNRALIGMVKMTDPVPTIETRCPGCGRVDVVPRPWTGSDVCCRHCQRCYHPTMPPWEVPQSREGEPVSPQLRQALNELSAIMREPDRVSLAQEVSVVESL